jgi:hypothetical protein
MKRDHIFDTEIQVDGNATAVALIPVAVNGILMASGLSALALLAGGAILLSGWVALYLTLTKEAHCLQALNLTSPVYRRGVAEVRILRAA